MEIMNWDEIWKICLGVLTSIGGISGLIIVVIKFSVNMIAKKLEEKYTLKLDKELEKYKTLLENKNYKSKVKFDIEVEIYRKLLHDFSCATRDVYLLFPIIDSEPVDLEELKRIDREKYNKALYSVVSAQNTLYENIPFIQENVILLYKDILKKCNSQLFSFERRWNVSFRGTYDEKRTVDSDVYDNNFVINDKMEEASNLIRTYLASWDDIE